MQTLGFLVFFLSGKPKRAQKKPPATTQATSSAMSSVDNLESLLAAPVGSEEVEGDGDKQDADEGPARKKQVSSSVALHCQACGRHKQMRSSTDRCSLLLPNKQTITMRNIR